jgi:hypothetical protein
MGSQGQKALWFLGLYGSINTHSSKFNLTNEHLSTISVASLAVSLGDGQLTVSAV